MIDWLWKSKEQPKKPVEPKNENSLDFLPPDLKDFYDANLPPTPIELAPKDVQEQYRNEESNLKSREAEIKRPGDDDKALHPLSESETANGLPLAQAARNNCVEFEALLADCALHGTYWERLNMCQSYRRQQMKCVDLQTAALQVLGYNRALNDQQRHSIQSSVDDIYSDLVPNGPITEAVQTKFEKTIEQERRRIEQYRV